MVVVVVVVVVVVIVVAVGLGLILRETLTGKAGGGVRQPT